MLSALLTKRDAFLVQFPTPLSGDAKNLFAGVYQLATRCLLYLSNL